MRCRKLWRRPYTDPALDEMVARRHLRFQADAMEADYPALKPIVLRPWLMLWEGEVTPVGRSYILRVSYMQGVRTAETKWAYQPPKVNILKPHLARRPQAPEERLPHVYRDAHPPELCLWFPGSEEWTPQMAISKSIVPWACEWLARYELWLATGEWTGPAEHPRERLPTLPSAASPSAAAAGRLAHELDLPLLGSMDYLLRRQSG